MLKRFPLLFRFMLFLFLPILVITIFGVIHLGNGLPQESGVLAAKGLTAEVEIRRDEAGIPTIVAKNDHDAFFAMGYAHAQDRMWQLELQRRIAYGRLSEAFGKDSIDQDIWFRTLGLGESAKSAWKALDPEAKASLQAYADGINAWLATRPILPVEFTVAGIKPEPWSVYDSLAWVKVFALNLGGNYRQEIERMLARQMLAPDHYASIYPNVPGSEKLQANATATRVSNEALQRLASFQDTLEQRLAIGGRYVGSNAWVVSGAHTADRKPILANDPHLGLQMPSLWYMAALKGDRLDVRGATLVGLPTVIFGRNQRIAWGGTNFMADAQDLYFEQTDPDDLTRYRVGNDWAKFDTNEEVIVVRQDPPAFLSTPLRPLRIKIRKSRHGPIISDLFKVFDQPVALRWTALAEDDTSYQTFLRLNYAHDWSEFRMALSYQVAPALNLLYADVDGNIGHMTAGRVPLRRSGRGDVPAPGWDDSHAWAGYIPADEMPSRFNPPDGILVSANERFFDDRYPHHVSDDWAPPDRARRIESLLTKSMARKTPMTVATMGRIQLDTVSEPARRLLVRMLRHTPNNDQQRRALGLLRAWNGDMGRSSQAATIFNVWVRNLRRELMSDEIRGEWNRDAQSRYLRGIAESADLDKLSSLLTDGPESWCQDRDTPGVETCDDILDASLNDSLWDILKMTGDESMDEWEWGDLHYTVYRHTPFSQSNLLRSVFERDIGSGGSPDTVNVATYRYDRAGRFTQDFGAGFRQIIGLGDQPGAHLYMNSTGQSGNVISRHYDDMIEPFRNGRLNAWPTTRAPGRVLRLRPATTGAGQETHR
jgi:penicillin G amidase